jgi:hypothetical protein
MNDKFKITFTDKEKGIIEFFFELPGKRALSPKPKRIKLPPKKPKKPIAFAATMKRNADEKKPDIPKEIRKNPRKDPLEDIKNKLIDFVTNGTDYMYGGIGDWATWIEDAFGDERFYKIVEDVEGFLTRKDLSGLMNYVDELEKEMGNTTGKKLKNGFKADPIDLYFVLYLNQKMIDFIRKIVKLSPTIEKIVKADVVKADHGITFLTYP